jgi:hypothetical protein
MSKDAIGLAGSRADAADPEMRFRQFGVELAGLPEQLARLEVILARYLMEVPGSVAHEIPSRHVTGVTCRREPRFGPEQLRLDRASNALGNLVLNDEQLGQFEIVSFGPDVGSRAGRNELGGDTDPLIGFAHASFDYIADAQLTGRIDAELRRADRPVLEGETGIARNDREPVEPRQRDDDILGNPVDESCA